MGLSEHGSYGPMRGSSVFHLDGSTCRMSFLLRQLLIFGMGKCILFLRCAALELIKCNTVGGEGGSWRKRKEMLLSD